MNSHTAHKMPTSLVERKPPILATGAEDANSKSALAHRARAGRLSWSGPLVVVTGRSLLIIAAQALVAGLGWMRFHVWSWNGAAKWWTVYATLVDAGCLAYPPIAATDSGALDNGFFCFVLHFAALIASTSEG